MDPKILIVGCESTGERFIAALTNHLKEGTRCVIKYRWIRMEAQA